MIELYSSPFRLIIVCTKVNLQNNHVPKIVSWITRFIRLGRFRNKNHTQHDASVNRLNSNKLWNSLFDELNANIKHLILWMVFDLLTKSLILLFWSERGKESTKNLLLCRNCIVWKVISSDGKSPKSADGKWRESKTFSETVVECLEGMRSCESESLLFERVKC